MENIILQTDNIGKRFGALEALKDISISVTEGETVSIIGPSGSGKSTLLRCVNQLELIDSGSMRVCGEQIARTADGKTRYASKDVLRRAQLSIGMAFQNFNLFPHFSVLRNITEAQIRVLGASSADAQETARALLAKLNLENKADEYPCNLSGGQQQRVAIARALALRPKALCFDEPTSALDPELTGEILSVLRALAKDKMTMLIVTHEMDFAREVAERAIFMDSGVIVEQGASDEVITRPSSDRVRSFLRRVQKR